MSKLDAAQLLSVKGLVGIVTGASSGLGESVAHALDVNGACKVFILGRREAKLNEVAAAAVGTFFSSGPFTHTRLQKTHSLIPIVCDTASKESLMAAAEVIKKQTLFVNLLIANLGVLGAVTSMVPRPTKETVAEVQEQLWSATTFEGAGNTLSVNLAGSYFTFIAFLKLLGAGNTHPESPGKSGLLQSQFITNSSFGGLCQNEAPSYVYSGSVAYQAILATRTGNQEDISGSVLFLASRAGSFVNGCVLLSDGGMLSVRPGSY